jgi:hypothetical protein
MFLLSFHANSKADGQKLREILMDEIRLQIQQLYSDLERLPCCYATEGL